MNTAKNFKNIFFNRTTPMAASENAFLGFSQEIPALLKWIEIHFNMGNSYFSIPSRLIRKVIEYKPLKRCEFFDMEEYFDEFTVSTIVSSLYHFTIFSRCTISLEILEKEWVEKRVEKECIGNKWVTKDNQSIFISHDN